MKKPGRDGDTFSDAAAQLRVATPGKMADFFREFCNHGSFPRRLTYRCFLGRFKVGEISIVEVVHFLIFGIPLDIRRPELSKAMRRKVGAEICMSNSLVGNTVGGSGIRRVFPPGMYKTSFFNGINYGYSK